MEGREMLHKDAKLGRDHPGINLNLAAMPAALGPRSSTKSMAVTLVAPPMGPLVLLGHKAMARTQVFTRLVVLPIPPCSALWHGEELE